MSFQDLYFKLGATNGKNWVGQKGHSGFSIRWHEKHEWTFWPTQYLSEITKDHEVKGFISLAFSLFDKSNKGSISLLNADTLMC